MKSFLFRQISIAPLVFMRIVFGILGFADVMGTFTYKHLYKQSLQADAFHFKYYGFDWVHPMPEPLMSLFFVAMLFLAILITLGKQYRLATTLFAFGFLYLFLIEKGYYLNHGYLFTMMCFVMIFLPANCAFSWDVLEQPKLFVKRIPYWPIFLFQFMIGVVYFYGGIAKINSDWLNAQPLKIWLEYKGSMPILGPLWKQDWVAWGMAYGGVIFDLTVVFLLLNKRTRIFALCLAIFFHTVNTILFKIGIFPTLSLCCSMLFFVPEFPENVLHWLRSKTFKPLRYAENLWQAKLNQFVPEQDKNMTHTTGAKRWIQYLIGAFIIFHLLLPFRHHLFQDHVAWTEEGHRYSWRMMLRNKNGTGYYKIKDKAGGKSKRIEITDYVSNKMARKCKTHPDMILQLAHHIRDEYKAKGKDIEIYAHIKVQLNGRPWQKYIDSKVDLAEVEWKFFEHSDWILPFENTALPK